MEQDAAVAGAALLAGAPVTTDPDGTSGLWVFGYGSLCWHPGFQYHRSVTGYIRGYARKFWQGNTTHRGTETQPGRVATLVEDKEGTVWGRAFEISGEAALPYLANRECKLGGYITRFVTFFPQKPCTTDETAPWPSQPFPALLYVATPSNPLWLGDASLSSIASQIVSSHGATGHNVEYLLRLADYMRLCAPEAVDDHLFGLEARVRTLVREKKLCLETLMGGQVQTRIPGYDEVPSKQEQQAGPPGAPGPAQAPPEPRPDSFEFTSRVPSKKLRCLNI